MYSDQELLQNLPGFENKYAVVNGVSLHYVQGGKGEPLILIPGWPETWWAYHKVMPLLALHYNVIVVDLRGMGGSDKPSAGYDKKNMSKDIYDLIQLLHYEKVHICGHDIGAHVAFSFAANYPEATGKLMMLDTPHPDDSMYQLPMLPIPGLNYTYPWWLAFNQVKELPEALLADRMHLVIDWIFNTMLQHPHHLTDFDRAVYSQAYDSPEAIRSSNAWYQAFTQDIQDMKTYHTISSPVMGIACSNIYQMLKSFLTKATAEVRLEEIEDSGHFLLAEQPQAIARLIIGFLK
ncbi:alpha/beta fold hydrolase [Chitinophaga pinensis]|uniref:Alpha/beta hydrolase fold protein n=1 Tax=Chitinophaga pinensis (strain ATCC 43595 / DSM 2588 / LMG 13176 / NBRC 15968 / NCIMB 11800 / UQM 2034) TaxID=485918 RepID=A0A979GQS7_CHIPD|nr:alpha/beta hydrolase [Chitinophaga pinensis]ACU60348.1 alpha/beta hydrolase fold protein [Chitinophaga pinensis DSM 2588]